MYSKRQLNKTMMLVHGVFLLGMFAFGNNFLKFRLVIPSFFLVVYFLLCLIHVFASCWVSGFVLRIKRPGQIEKTALAFIVLCLLYGVLSYIGVFDHSVTDGLNFNRNYILRHMMMLDLLPIGLSMYIVFLDPVFERWMNKPRHYLYIPLYILILIPQFRTTEANYLLILLLYLEYSAAETKVKRAIILIMMISLFALIYQMGTVVLMMLMCLLLLPKNNLTFNALRKYRLLIGTGLVITACMAVLYLEPLMNWVKSADPNTWWRMYYWSVELKIAAARKWLGVGYGTAYATKSIFNVLQGGFIDPVTQLFSHDASVLFTTAQHNSYMNILYRTGIIGFILFVSINFNLLFQGIRKTPLERTLMLAFINATLLILLNVGLESPRFLILFYVGFFGVMSLYRRRHAVPTQGSPGIAADGVLRRKIKGETEWQR